MSVTVPRLISLLGAVAPPVAARIAHRVWSGLGTPAPVRDRDRAVHERATRGTLEVRGERVETYTWGAGPEVVLLVHGWRSRASRFSALVSALESPDRTIVAFDAIGNGGSTGTRTTVLDYAEIIRRLGERHGAFELVVGHSIGVLATFLAVREGVIARRLVDVAGVADADSIIRTFSAGIGIRGQAVHGLRRLVETRTFPDVPNPWQYFRTEIDPAHTHVPLLVVHDIEDAVVPIADAVAIAELHTGPVETLITRGLGHARILSDPEVVARIADFAISAAGATRSAASSPGTPSGS
jgi:pimeloyl-ACP methyl ester carboxylesterase